MYFLGRQAAPAARKGSLSSECCYANFVYSECSPPHDKFHFGNVARQVGLGGDLLVQEAVESQGVGSDSDASRRTSFRTSGL